MGIRFACHACQHRLNIKNQLAGKKGKCPACGARFQIPRADQPFSIPLEADEPAEEPNAEPADKANAEPADKANAEPNDESVAAPAAADVPPADALPAADVPAVAALPPAADPLASTPPTPPPS